MSTNLEIEAKTLISKDDYLKARNFMINQGELPFLQTNFYIETPEQTLLKHGISLRIRSLNGFNLTMKVPLAEGLLEKNQVLTEDDFKLFKQKNKFPAGEIGNFIEMIGVDLNSLGIVSTLMTERYEMIYEGCRLAVDKNIYGQNGNKEDFELEMEGTSIENAKEKLQQFCAEHDITYKENIYSKQYRAMRETKKGD
jgi:uncharacterized protein YjbK